MTEPFREPEPSAAVDIGDYCRRVEAHLAGVNQGHLVRIAGVGFEMVRQWALDGIPLSVVSRGIDQKAERHRAGRSARPLRIEFCDTDVRALFADWRRAIGAGAASLPGEVDSAVEDVRRPSLSKHLDRVIAALTRAVGRLELPTTLRTALTTTLEGATAVQEEARRVRGAARSVLPGRLLLLDRAMLEAARTALTADDLDDLRRSAAVELAPYRSRMTPEVWTRSIELGTDRLLRDHFGLPTVEP